MLLLLSLQVHLKIFMYVTYFNLNAVSFIQQVGGTDVLFAMNTYSATGQNHNYIESIRTQ